MSSVLAVLVSATSSAQTVYTWKDARGVTHYSESAPKAGKVDTLGFKETDPVLDADSLPAPAATAAAQPQSAGDPLEAAKRDYPKLACASAQANQKVLQGHGIVVANDGPVDATDAGSARKLSPEEIKVAAAEAQKQIDQFCDRG